MADNIDFRRYAGHVVFPRNPSDLINTNQCPACFTPLASTICAACGLNLSNPAATELLDASRAAAASLDERLAIIGQIRYETAYPVAEAATPTPIQPLAPPPIEPAPLAPQPTVAPVSAPAALPTRIAPPAAAPTPLLKPESAPKKPSKYSSVQVTMLVVGVSLLSVAAIFFLVYAYITFGIVWQSVIIAALTAAVITAATLLRRHQLPATAEGFAVFGVVLVYLDVFAIRANNLFQLASADEYIYWGAAILLASVAFMVWSHLASLRGPRIIGFSSFAPGVGVLIAGLAQDGEPGAQGFFTAAAIAAAGLIHRWVLPRATGSEPRATRNIERVISLATTTGALFIGFFFAMAVAPDSDWYGTLAVLALVALTAAHLWAVAPPSATRPIIGFAYMFSVLGAIFAASALSVAGFRISSEAFVVTAPLIAAAVVALGLDALTARGAARWKKFAKLGAFAAGGIFVLTAIKPLVVIGIWTAWIPTLGPNRTWALAATDAPTLLAEHPGWSVLSFTIVGLLAAAFWTYAKVLHTRGPILAWFGAAVAVVAVPLLTTLGFIVAGWLTLAVASSALLSIRMTRAMMPAVYRGVLQTITVVSGFLAYLISWASVSTWWIASLVVVVLLIVARVNTTRNDAKAALLAFAAVLTLFASFFAALHIDFVSNAHLLTSLSVTNGLRFSSIVAAILFAIFAAPVGRTVTTTDRRVMFWLTGGVAALLLSAMWTNLLRLSVAERTNLILPESTTTLIAQLIVLAAIIAWIALPTVRSLRPERVTASVLAAPVVYFAVVAVTKVTVLPEFAVTVAAISSALVVAAIALTLASVKPSSVPRWPLDIGVAIVAIPSVLVAAITGGHFAWFVLILAAVAVLFLATSRDGLFASASPRKHLGWVAIVLATGGLWWQLGNRHIEALEPYVLPLAAVLLATAILIAWAELRKARKNTDDVSAQSTLSPSAAPLVALGGLLVAILPLSVNAITGSLTRAIVIASVSAALLLAGSFTTIARKPEERSTAGFRWQPWWDAAALAGALGVIVTSIGRATTALATQWTGEIWLGAALAVLLAAGIGQARTARGSARWVRTIGSQALAIIPLTAVLLRELSAFSPAEFGLYRALGLIVLFAAVTTLCFTINRAPFGRALGEVSTAFWAVATIAAVWTFSWDLLLALAPVASALVVAAIALGTTLLRIGTTQRWVRDLGVMIVTAISVWFSIGLNAPHTWLVLFVAAVAVLLLAIDNDGLFSSKSGRRQLGWVSLALATGGLWWRLWSTDVTDLLPYVLPLAGALLLIAVLVEFAHVKKTDDETAHYRQAAPMIALGGLLVGILPLAVSASTSTSLRAIIIGAVSAVLLVAGSFIVGSRAASRWWDSAAIAGGVGVLALMIERAITLPVTDPFRDAWVIAGFAVLFVAAIGQGIPRRATTDPQRRIGSEILSVTAMVAVLATEFPAFGESPSGQYRVLGLVILFSAIHVFALQRQRAPLSFSVGWTAISLAGISAIVGMVLGSVETLEFVTVPIALALLATGGLHLRKAPTSGSWLWLAPGLLVLLVPTLIENLRDQALWRIVGLGVVAIAVILIGLVHKLQAPFTLGVVVVLIHGISTFLPELRAAYEFVPWWLWLGLGGTVLIAVAVRFEQRSRDMRTIIMKFSELR